MAEIKNFYFNRISKLSLCRFYIIVFFLIGFSITCAAQINTSKSKKYYLIQLSKDDWYCENSWFGDSIVTLKSFHQLPIDDTVGMTMFEKEIYFKENPAPYYKIEKIHFEKNGNFSYQFYIDCPVGETIYEVRKIKILNGYIKVDFQVYEWNNGLGRYKKVKYQIVEFNEHTISLKLIN